MNLIQCNFLKWKLIECALSLRIGYKLMSSVVSLDLWSIRTQFCGKYDLPFLFTNSITPSSLLHQFATCNFYGMFIIGVVIVIIVSKIEL